MRYQQKRIGTPLGDPELEFILTELFEQSAIYRMLAEAEHEFIECVERALAFNLRYKEQLEDPYRRKMLDFCIKVDREVLEASWKEVTRYKKMAEQTVARKSIV